MLFFDKGIKMTNINYEISLKTEIMNEAYTGLIADFIDYFKVNKIDWKDNPPEKEPMMLLFRKTQDTYHRLMQMNTLEELQEVIGQFKLMDKLLSDLRNNYGK